MTDRIEDRPLEALPCKVETEVGGASAKTVRLVPDGEVQSKRGNLILDAQGAAAIIAEFDKHETPLVIDYEHATLGGEFATPDGRARAAGWINKLWYEPGRGLMGSVKWNREALEDIRSASYLFLSPVLMVRKVDRRAVGLHSAALTNKPAIAGMDRLAASESSPKEETDMNGTKQADAEGAERGEQTPDKLLVKIQTLLKQQGVTLEEGASREAVLEAVIEVLGGASNEGADKTPESAARGVETHAAVLSATLGQAQELAAMKAKEADRLADERLQVYLDKGVLVEAWIPMMEAARFLAANDPDRFESLMSHAVPIIPQGRTEAPSGGSGRRPGIIAEARRCFSGDAFAMKSTSELAFVNLALRDANLDKLTEDELTAYSITKPTD